MIGKSHASRLPSAPLLGALAPLPWWVAWGALATMVACSNGGADQITSPVDLGMTSTVAPYYADGNLTLYQVNVPVVLPVRRPSPSESQSLGAAPAGTPYPHAPFLPVQDESLEVHYVISNLDSTPQTVTLLIDPWNEFVRWNPGVTVVDDDESTPNFGYDLSFRVPALSRVEGDLTTDDMQEIAIKLAAVENVIAQAQSIANASMNDNSPDVTTLANHIFNPQNWSNAGDPLFTPWVPPVIAGLTGFDLGLRTVNAPANVAIEITIEVKDLHGDRFVAEDSSDPRLGIPPMVLSPPAATF
jgi:hypothetical protein